MNIAKKPRTSNPLQVRSTDRTTRNIDVLFLRHRPKVDSPVEMPCSLPESNIAWYASWVEQQGWKPQVFDLRDDSEEALAKVIRLVRPRYTVLNVTTRFYRSAVRTLERIGEHTRVIVHGGIIDQLHQPLMAAETFAPAWAVVTEFSESSLAVLLTGGRRELFSARWNSSAKTGISHGRRRAPWVEPAEADRLNPIWMSGDTANSANLALTRRHHADCTPCGAAGVGHKQATFLTSRQFRQILSALRQRGINHLKIGDSSFFNDNAPQRAFLTALRKMRCRHCVAKIPRIRTPTTDLTWSAYLGDANNLKDLDKTLRKQTHLPAVWHKSGLRTITTDVGDSESFTTPDNTFTGSVLEGNHALPGLAHAEINLTTSH